MDYKPDSKAEGKQTSFKADCKFSSSQSNQEVDESLFSDEKRDSKTSLDVLSSSIPHIEVLNVEIKPSNMVEISSPLSLSIRFSLDRDVVAAYWVVQFLVDSARSRIIRILGETKVEDYPDGESDMQFDASSIDVEGIAPSSLTNSGLLMAKLMADGEEVASVNMVVQVSAKNGRIMRQIFSPLD